MIDSGRARAHVNWGRWIASCPNVHCNSAEELHPWASYQCAHSVCNVMFYPDTVFHCSHCHTIAPIEWPPNADAIWDELLKRPKSETRNWYPEDHADAIKWNLPHGQSVTDLYAERVARSK